LGILIYLFDRLIVVGEWAFVPRAVPWASDGGLTALGSFKLYLEL